MAVKRLQLIFLHGFLGKAEDWDPVVQGPLTDSYPCHRLDYVQDRLLNPKVTDLRNWGSAFSQWLRGMELDPAECVLVGYSQGGRLALHALRSQPFLRGAILLSTNPGFRDTDEASRKARWLNDERWARRFESEPWADVVKDWNRQAVFSGGPGKEPDRTGSIQAAIDAAASLRSWTLSRQDDFLPHLAEEQNKSYFMFGERDEKFRRIWESMKERAPALRGHLVEGSGHRVLFDAPERLRTELMKILSTEL